ncbi:MAG: histidine kinase [Bacteroidota bacterium]|nr:histidine kinase [Bacteroidota bacterium]
MELLRNYSLLIFILILFSKIGYSNTYSEDSTLIVKLFENALQNPLEKETYFTKAYGIFEENKNNPEVLDTYYFNLSKYLFYTGGLDSALTVAFSGLELYKNDSLNLKKSKFHNLIGSVYSYKKDYKTGISEFQKSIEILEYNNDKKSVGHIKNNIANIFFSLTDYKSAHKYSLDSYKILKEEKDTIYLPMVTGILAISEIKLGNLQEGKVHSNESIKLSEKYNNPVGLIIGNYSKGELNLSENNYEQASDYFLKSLKLSTVYGQRHYVMLNKISLLYTNVQLKKFKEAIQFGEDALLESRLSANENTLYSIHKNLGYAYSGTGDYKKAYENINLAHDLYNNTANAQNKGIINEILIKYDTEKKEKEITLSELKLAQKTVALNKRNIWIAGLLMVIFVIVLSYYFYTRLQGQKMLQLQKEQEKKILTASFLGEEKERERISNQMHDGVASSITAIKIQLENALNIAPNENINNLVGQLSSLHEETRRISHNLMPVALSDNNLFEAINNYCTENSRPDFKLYFNDNTAEKIILNATISNVLYRIIQELINNVQKHSKSSICHVQTSFDQNELTISVEDEGIGFDPTIRSFSQGLNSIEKRMKDLSGEFIIDSGVNKGTLASIHLKLS